MRIVKTLMLAGAVSLFSFAPVQAGIPASVDVQGCTSCGISEPVKLGQRSAAMAQEAQGPGWQQGDTRPLQTCCDPNLATMSWGAFTDDLDATNPSFFNRYGVKFAPSLAFHTAMQNTRSIVHIMLNNPAFSAIIMQGEMKTDNVPADSPSLGGTNTAEDAHNGTGASYGVAPHTGTTAIQTSWMSAWWGTAAFPTSPGTPWATNAFQLSSWGTGPHMRADNTIYTLKPSFFVYYRVRDRWYVRQLLCNNLKDRFAGFQKGGNGFKIAGGGGSNGNGFVEGKAIPNASNMRLGVAREVTPDEVKRLQDLERGRN